MSGIIFSNGLHEKVLDGTKTVTRRPVITADRTLSNWHIDRCPTLVGKTRAVVPGRSQKGVGRILITGVKREQFFLPTNITTAEAHREGFASRSGFLDTWAKLHGKLRTPMDVWRVEFEVCDG